MRSAVTTWRNGYRCSATVKQRWISFFGEQEMGAPRRMRPLVVLLDLKLPKVDGFTVLQRVKSDPVTRTIPIVVFTSSREERDLRQCYELGVNSYVVKPLDFGELTQAIRDLGVYWLECNEPPG